VGFEAMPKRTRVGFHLREGLIERVAGDDEFAN
jgi:hypothetical protein